ncbi:XRE family transcriptional regulator [Nocardia sp. NPDC056611]|uniref:XRE family transcriptional regulator n=1 Tax=Nocardia sp. NPDC056611 TaxID=3345877 RepID=UPI00366EEA3F
MGFREWKQVVSNGDSDRAIAARMGTNQMRVARHLSSDSPVAETVIAFSRTYGASPIEGLIAAGFLTRDDVLRASLVEALREATGAELAAEVTRRLTDPDPDAAEGQPTTT